MSEKDSKGKRQGSMAGGKGEGLERRSLSALCSEQLHKPKQCCPRPPPTHPLLNSSHSCLFPSHHHHTDAAMVGITSQCRATVRLSSSRYLLSCHSLLNDPIFGYSLSIIRHVAATTSPRH